MNRPATSPGDAAQAPVTLEHNCGGDMMTKVGSETDLGHLQRRTPAKRPTHSSYRV